MFKNIRLYIGYRSRYYKIFYAGLVLITMDTSIFQKAVEASQYLHDRVPPALREPALGIVCGSGLNSLGNNVLPHPQTGVSYTDIPHFPETTGITKLNVDLG